jgi:rhamnose utilization protein RhaD (predicted bifunctional aldolase and dehydrogenase)
MTPPQELSDLLWLSQRVGKDPDWVQGGGGNTSVKSADGTQMWVKASGTTLVEMQDDRGWALVDRARTEAVLDLPDLQDKPDYDREQLVLQHLQEAVHHPAGARPSVESTLHALLDRVVIHSHPIGLGAVLCADDSRAQLHELMEAETPPALVLPYVDPGYTLAVQVRRGVREYVERHGKRPAVVLLQNHGLVVSAENAEDCVRLHERVTTAGMQSIGRERVNPLANGGRSRVEQPAWLKPLTAALQHAGCGEGIVATDEAPVAAEWLQHRDLKDHLLRGALTPDQIVYCRTFTLELAADPEGWRQAAEDYRARFDLDPRVVVIPGQGLAYFAPDPRQLQVVAEVFRGAIAAMLHGRPPRFLSREQAAFIENWEVEKFRADLLAGGGESSSS